MILEILGCRPLRGYGIAQELEKHGWDVIPGGTLCPTLRTLGTKGLVTGSWRTVGWGLARKYYRSTQAGLGLLSRQRTQWDALSRSMAWIPGREADHDERGNRQAYGRTRTPFLLPGRGRETGPGGRLDRRIPHRQ